VLRNSGQEDRKRDFCRERLTIRWRTHTITAILVCGAGTRKQNTGYTR